MSCNILIPNVLLCKLREKQATSQTMLRAESPHLQVVSCNLIVITEHLVKVEGGKVTNRWPGKMRMNHLEKRQTQCHNSKSFEKGKPSSI